MVCVMTKYQVTEHRGKNCIVRIHKPILTAEEEKAREANLRAAIVRFERERMRNQK